MSKTGRLGFLSCVCLLLSVSVAIGGMAVEAESGRLQGSVTADHAGASGGRLVRLTGRVKGTLPEGKETPNLFLPFEVNESGRWRLELRYYAPNGGSDSFFWSLDGSDVKVVHAKSSPDLQWLSLGAQALKAGRHELRFWQRERGFGIDSLSLEKATEPPKRLRYGGFLTVSDARPLDMSQAVSVTRHEAQWSDGVKLKPGVKPFVKPTFVMPLEGFAPGEYKVLISARTASLARQNLLVQVDGGAKRRRRVIYYSGNVFTCDLQRIMLSKGSHELSFYLPEGMEFYRLRLQFFKHPAVPQECVGYRPPLIPHGHPRLLVNQEVLTGIRAGLGDGQNQRAWQEIVKVAHAPYVLKVGEYGIDVIDSSVFPAIQSKAFYYLLEKDRKIGLEAVSLARRYLEAVDPGIQEEYTRPIGSLIFSSAMAYDWCYDLLTPEDKASMERHMLQLASKMEIGWPPFGQPILVGHGNECQLSKNLLAMAIAIYDENPEPYRLCAYRVFEELVDGQTFIYGSGRHDQGTAYGGRHVFDLYAAWHMKRLGGGDIFKGALKEIPYFWTYAGTPDGKLLPRGDDYADFGIGNYSIPWFSAMFHGDRRQLGEYYRRGVLNVSPVEWLLFNRADLKPEDDLSGLPLVKAYGNPLGGMAIRTGWNRGRKASDLVIDLAGMDLHFANHHHLDGGAFQIYYKGLLTCDLGMYWYYGTPYDMKYNKRGIPHNVLLMKGTEAGDPADGGMARKGWNGPRTRQQQEDPFFRLGRTSGQAFGPDPALPVYATMRCDLSKGYAGRAKAYVRNFVFHNFSDGKRPGMLVILDRVRGLRQDVRPYFVLNSLTEPTVDGGHVVQASADGGTLDMQLLLPQAVRSELVHGGEKVDVFGKTYPVPYKRRKQGKGRRVMITPTGRERDLSFLAVLQIQDRSIQPLRAELLKHDQLHVVRVQQTLTVCPKGLEPLGKAVRLTVPGKGLVRVVVTDLVPGDWSIERDGHVLGWTPAVQGVLYAELQAGDYIVSPGRVGGRLQSTAKAVQTPAPPRNVVLLDDVVVPGVRPVKGNGQELLLPLKATLTALDIESEVLGERQVRVKGIDLIAGQHGIRSDGHGELLVPSGVVGGVLGMEAYGERELGSVWLEGQDRVLPVVFVTASLGDGAVLRDMLNGLDTGGVNFSANGTEVICDITLREVQELSGLALAWSQGSVRKERFEIAISEDGTSFRTVFDGMSSGETTDLEPVTWNRGKVRSIRLRMKGNTRNSWNVITGIRLLK